MVFHTMREQQAPAAPTPHPGLPPQGGKETSDASRWQVL